MRSTTGRRPDAAAPTAAPTMVASDNGIFQTRWLPNSSANPRVEPMTLRSASSPNSTTVGSSRMASAIPSRIALMKNVVTGIFLLRNRRLDRALGEDIRQRCGRVGQRTRFGKGKAVLDTRDLPGVQVDEFSRAEDAGLNELIP